MQITIGAKCWDGMRSKSLSDFVKVEGLPEVIRSQSRFVDMLKRGAKRMNDPKVKAVLGYSIPLVLLASGLPPLGLTRAFASSLSPTVVTDVAIPAMSSAVKTKIIHAFDPLIDLIMSLSFPIAGVMIAGGCLFILVGNRERGMQMLQNAAIGYILVQLSPLFLDLLVGIGDSV